MSLNNTNKNLVISQASIKQSAANGILYPGGKQENKSPPKYYQQPTSSTNKAAMQLQNNGLKFAGTAAHNYPGIP